MENKNQLDDKTTVIAKMREIFHFDNYKNAHQKRAIETILGEKNCKNFVINMATQGGKSLCFQLPGVMKKIGITIVLTPALASIYDQLSYLRSLNIEAVTINSDTPYESRDYFKGKITEENSLIRFLFITPEIFGSVGNAGNVEWFRNLISNGTVNYIVVDEAHKILDADFREDFKGLKNFRSLNLAIPWIALTTINKNLEGKIAEELNMQNPIYLTSTSVRENIFYEAIPDGTIEVENIINFFKRIKKDSEIPAGIIFCKTYNDIEATINYLYKNGVQADRYHGNLQGAQRVIQRWFDREFSVLVATGQSFGFGINYHVPVIRFVIHLGMPEKLRSFYHESGRAGNDGRLGYSRVYNQVSFLQLVPVSMEFLKYHNSTCRKKYIAEFFGEEIKKCGNSCDKCSGKAREEELIK